MQSNLMFSGACFSKYKLFVVTSMVCGIFTWHSCGMFYTTTMHDNNLRSYFWELCAASLLWVWQLHLMLKVIMWYLIELRICICSCWKCYTILGTGLMLHLWYSDECLSYVWLSKWCIDEHGKCVHSIIYIALMLYSGYLKWFPVLCVWLFKWWII